MKSNRVKINKIRIEHNPNLTRDQLLEIAHLHYESIPWSFNASVGVEHLYNLYSIYVRQPDFRYFVAFSNENRILGLCSSLKSEGTYNLCHYFKLFCIYAKVLYRVNLGDFFRSLKIQSTLRLRRKNMPESAHITTLFVHPSNRGKKIGQSLLLETEKCMLREGIFLLTVDVDANAENALKWYEQVQFKTCFSGGDFLLLQKEIVKRS